MDATTGIVVMIDLVEMYMGLLASGVVMTILIATASFAMGFGISALITLLRFFAPRYFSSMIKVYVDFFRGTPLLVQLLFMYFGLPSIGIRLDAVTAAIIAIGLNSGAYQAEILRTAAKNIPEEQIAVAKAMGLTSSQVYWHVVAPQVFLGAIPGLVNEFVMLIKESSLASVIGIMELTRVGEYMTSATFRALESFATVALIYLALSYIVYTVFRRVEKAKAIPGFERWAR